jgi:hypothetical protein
MSVLATRERFIDFVTRLDRRLLAVLIGLLIGGLGAGIGVAIALVGPVYTGAAVVGVLGGLYVLSDIRVALYGIVATMMLLPFGTLPFSIGFTPTLIDVMIGAFMLVYALQWMTGNRRGFRLTPPHVFIAIYVLWLLITFALGLRFGELTPLIMRQFSETLLVILMVYVLVDLVRDVRTLQRLVVVVIVGAAIQAAIALVLYRLPDDLTERLLRTLSRIGYPDSNIVRYIEQNPELAERAIGTWVDPNTLGGALAIMAAVIAPHAVAQRPALRPRIVTLFVFGLVGLALYLTYSRTSMAALAAAVGMVALVRYRRFIPMMAGVLLLIVLLPQTQGYVERFIDAFTGGDLATQMRIGEYGDSFRLISQYPIFGIGFTGSPSIDLYADVASQYLLMANQIGVVGVALYAVMVFSVLGYGIHAWPSVRGNPVLEPLHLGFHAGVIAAVVSGIGDLYYFRIDFQGSITLYWLVVALALTTSRLALDSKRASVSGSPVEDGQT